MQEHQKHSVVIDQRKNLTVSGVESVIAFSEVKITLSLLDSERMHIVGTDLKIVGFSKSNGTFTAEGTVISVAYGGKSLAAKIFK